MSRSFYIYILTNEKRNSFYVGMTDDLARRVAEHRSGAIEGFAKRNHLKTLVYHQEFQDVQQAMKREKQLKKQEDAWMERIIDQSNPTWSDLGAGFGEG